MALRSLSRGNLWCALGAGGKTSLLFALASMAPSGVVASSGPVRTPPADWEQGAGPPWNSDWVYCTPGSSSRDLQNWAQAEPDRLFLMDSDGSKGRPLKLVPEYEAVDLPGEVGLVILVVGMSAWGQPVQNAVQGSELLAQPEGSVGLSTYVEVIERSLSRCQDVPLVLLFSQVNEVWRRAWALEIAGRFPQLPALWRHHSRWGWLSRGTAIPS